MQPAPLAVLAHIGDARAHRVLGAAECARVAVDPHDAGGGPEPEDRLRRLRATRADETREAHDLARAHREIDAGAAPFRAEPYELENRLRIARGALVGVDRTKRATDHRCGKRMLVDRNAARVAQRAVATDELLHQHAVAQHAHAIRDRDDFFEMMRDEDDRAPLVAQRPHAREKPRRLLFAEHRGRLVEDQHAGVAREALRDLDELRLGHRKKPRFAPEIDVRPERTEQFARAPPLRRAVDRHSAERGRLAPERHILGDIERRHEVELLVHHRDAGAQRIGRLPELHGAPVEHRDPRGRTHRARQHLHQRALAGTVLAHDRMDLSCAKRHRDPVERPYARVLDRDHACLEQARGRGGAGDIATAGTGAGATVLYRGCVKVDLHGSKDYRGVRFRADLGGNLPGFRPRCLPCATFRLP